MVDSLHFPNNWTEEEEEEEEECLYMTFKNRVYKVLRDKAKGYDTEEC